MFQVSPPLTLCPTSTLSNKPLLTEPWLLLPPSESNNPHHLLKHWSHRLLLANEQCLCILSSIPVNKPFLWISVLWFIWLLKQCSWSSKEETALELHVKSNTCSLQPSFLQFARTVYDFHSQIFRQFPSAPLYAPRKQITFTIWISSFCKLLWNGSKHADTWKFIGSKLTINQSRREYNSSNFFTIRQSKIQYKNLSNF